MLPACCMTRAQSTAEAVAGGLVMGGLGAALGMSRGGAGVEGEREGEERGGVGGEVWRWWV